jgi:hypothetical protein
MAVPDLRVAICRRCRWPSRIASGAAGDQALLELGRARGQAHTPPCHARLSQCLNSCDGGHTVRLEHHGWEFAFVGIRTEDELDLLLDHAPCIVQLPEAIARRVGVDAGTTEPLDRRLEARLYQVWRDGRLCWHRNTEG